MADKVLPADDFIESYQDEHYQGAVFGDFAYPRKEVIRAMIAFAKAHVKAALLKAANDVETGGMGVTARVRVKISIIKAYPEENIE